MTFLCVSAGPDWKDCSHQIETKYREAGGYYPDWDLNYQPVNPMSSVLNLTTQPLHPSWKINGTVIGTLVKKNHLQESVSSISPLLQVYLLKNFCLCSLSELTSGWWTVILTNWGRPSADMIIWLLRRSLLSVICPAQKKKTVKIRCMDTKYQTDMNTEVKWMAETEIYFQINL